MSSISELSDTVPRPFQDDFRAQNLTNMERYKKYRAEWKPNAPSTLIPIDNEALAIRYLLQLLNSKNRVAEFLGGSKTTAYKRINRAFGEEGNKGA